MFKVHKPRDKEKDKPFWKKWTTLIVRKESNLIIFWQTKMNKPDFKKRIKIDSKSRDKPDCKKGVKADYKTGTSHIVKNSTSLMVRIEKPHGKETDKSPSKNSLIEMKYYSTKGNEIYKPNEEERDKDDAS